MANGKIWEQWEIDVLKNAPFNEHEQILPHRSAIAINKKRCKLKIKWDGWWTKEENEILINNTDKYIHTLLKLLPHRSESSIHSQRHNLGLDRPNGWTKEQKVIIEKSSDKTTEEIQKLIPNRSLIAINHKCSRLGIKRNEETITRQIVCTKTGLSFDKINEIANNPKFQEIITGCLLGDGCVGDSGFSYGSTSKEHVEFMQSNLNALGFSNNISSYQTKYDSAFKTGQIIKKENMKRSYSYSVGNALIFRRIRKMWYPNGTKIVPRSIILTPMACLCWYLGDGTLCTAQNKGNACSITLCTNGFNFEDHAVLSEKLKELNIKSVVHKNGRIKTNNEEECTLKLYGINTYRFLQYIGECTVNDYKHKWAIDGFKPISVPCMSCGKIIDRFAVIDHGLQQRCEDCKQKWSKEKIINTIQERRKLNLDLYSGSVSRKEKQLFLAAKRYFGSWNKALDAAGLNHEKVMKKTRWSKEKILIEIQKYKTLKTKRNPSLYDAAVYHFGSWQSAIKEAIQ